MEYVKQFDHIIHKNAMTDSCFCSQHDDCPLLLHSHVPPSDNYSA